MKIDVLQEDIDKGKARDCELCPVARAIRRHLPNAGIEVNTDEVVIWRDSHVRIFDLPEHVEKFIYAFDDGEATEEFGFGPFSFKLPVEANE